MKLETMDLLSCDAQKGEGFPKSINTNIAINSAVEEKGQLRVAFEYTAAYAPEGGHIRLTGRAVFSGSEAKSAAEEWAKNGRMTGANGELVMNAINYAASVNGVLIARAFNMTPPVVLATLAYGGKEAKK